MPDSPFAFPPAFPDFYICNEFYGTAATNKECIAARNQIPASNTPVVFEVDPNDPSPIRLRNTLPAAITSGQFQ